MTQYTQDYDEIMVPLDVDGLNAGDNGFSYPHTGMLQAYIKSRQIFRCPSDTNSLSGTRPIYSYTYNYWMGAGGGKKLSAIVLPAQTPTMTDAIGGAAYDEEAGYNFRVADQSAAPSTGPILPYSNSKLVRSSIATKDGNAGSDSAAVPYPSRHLDTGNFLFADGHVKALKYDADGATNRWSGSGNGSAANSNGAFPVTAGAAYVPPRRGYDYDGDGIVGNDIGYE